LPDGVAGVDKEIVANYVEINLFNNSKEIARLAKTHRNLVQVIRDWFTDLRVKFRGTAEEKELLRAQRLFEKALRETDVKGYRTSGNGQWTVEYTKDNKPYVNITEDILNGVPKSEWVKTVKNEMSLRFKNGITVGNNVIKVNLQTRKEFTESRDSKKLRQSNQTAYADKYKTAAELDNVIKASSDYVNELPNHTRTDNIVQFGRGKVLLSVGNNDYEAEVIIGTTKGNEQVLYDIINLTPTKINKKARSSVTAQPQSVKSRSSNNLANQTLPQTTSPVNTSGQASIDFEGQELLRTSSGRTAEEVRADTKAAVEQYSAMDPRKRPGVRDAEYPYETAQGRTMRTPHGRVARIVPQRNLFTV